MAEAAEIEALAQSSKHTKGKLLDIGANLRQQIEALEHVARPPILEEPASKRLRQDEGQFDPPLRPSSGSPAWPEGCGNAPTLHKAAAMRPPEQVGAGIFPCSTACGCGPLGAADGFGTKLLPNGGFDDCGCGCPCGSPGMCGSFSGCPGCGSCGPCNGPCNACGNSSSGNWGGSCSNCGCCGGCGGGCGLCGCSGCGSCSACGSCGGCGGCGNCACGNCGCGCGGCGGCTGCGNGCGGCGCGCTGCSGCGCGSCSAQGPGCDGMNSMNPMAVMMMGAAMMGQMMMASGDANGNSEALKRSKDDEEDTSTYGSSFNVNHPNYRPPDMEPKPGITDKRFVGRIKFWFETKGFGFIESEEFSKVFRGDSDVFLHHFQKRHFQRGDLVEFSVFTNFRGKPQGTELRKAKQ